MAGPENGYLPDLTKWYVTRASLEPIKSLQYDTPVKDLNACQKLATVSDPWKRMSHVKYYVFNKFGIEEAFF